MCYSWKTNLTAVGVGLGSNLIFVRDVPTCPPNLYPLPYKMFEKDTPSLTKFAKTQTPGNPISYSFWFGFPSPFLGVPEIRKPSSFDPCCSRNFEV